MRLDLEEKVAELQEFIGREGDMRDRAPDAWVNPQLPKCSQCGKENSAKPILGSTKKREINWLSQMLGCCTLNQLRYFCKHAQVHRTGAKNRLLYHTYMNLLKQFVPEWFHA
uniref:DUF7086 domain-containing protein n=2 Tax=Cajanus cajan TaxID=3821 RepID=A0A151TCX8_CAJCA|nr:hypothetical protein KK1_019522 [Cajanus cajan]